MPVRLGFGPERASAAPDSVAAIGISYQMHGLVVVDRAGRVLRPAIIWCDSRAVGMGEWAFEAIGPLSCLARYLNSPGNFTASKLKWVKEHEPAVFGEVHKAMLPGDYIAMRLTGETVTTETGLSEAILWDYLDGGMATEVLDVYGLPREPSVSPVVSLWRSGFARTLGVITMVGVAVAGILHYMRHGPLEVPAEKE